MKTLLSLIVLVGIIYVGWWAYNNYFAPEEVAVVEEVVSVAPVAQPAANN